MKIGIYGGSFDPPHIEHINLCVNAVKSLNLDRLFIVPAKIPPHKKVQPISGEYRLEMVKLALSNVDVPQITVSDFELNSAGKSYTYLTIEHFKSLYKDAQIYFLMGTDMLENFPTWKEPKAILNMAKLYVFGRDGESMERAKQVFLNAFSDRLNSLVFANFSGKMVSSTHVRHMLTLGLDAKEFLYQNVIDYIKSNNLYFCEKAEFVKKSLSISRLTHTLGVMDLAKAYAKKLGEDENKAVLAAMLHDVAKYMDKNDFPSFTLPLDVPKPVVHQYLGAYVAEHVLGVTDIDILNAIRYHTTGRSNMSRLEKIVFTADLLEVGRTYDEAPILREAVDKDFDAGFSLSVKRLLNYLTKQGQPIYYLTKECYNYYVNENGNTKN